MTRYSPLWLQQGSYAAGVDRRLIGALYPSGGVSGCAVSAGTGMTCNVAPGSVSVPTANNTGSTLCVSDAVENVTLSAAPASGTNRYDVIVCQPRGNDLDGGANNDFIFTVVTGTAAATPSVPAVAAGQLALANVYVPGGSASVSAGNITDRRVGALGVLPSVNGRLYRAGAQGTNTGVLGQINAMTTDYTTGGVSVSAGAGLVVPVNGKYLVSAQVSFASMPGFAGYTNVVVQQNGAQVRAGTQPGPAGSFPAPFVSDVVAAAAGDVFTLWEMQTSGGGCNVTGGTQYTFISVAFVST
jgi:hypothetical protein